MWVDSGEAQPKINRTSGADALPRSFQRRVAHQAGSILQLQRFVSYRPLPGPRLPTVPSCVWLCWHHPACFCFTAFAASCCLLRAARRGRCPASWTSTMTSGPRSPPTLRTTSRRQTQVRAHSRRLKQHHTRSLHSAPPVSARAPDSNAACCGTRPDGRPSGDGRPARRDAAGHGRDGAPHAPLPAAPSSRALTNEDLQRSTWAWCSSCRLLMAGRACRAAGCPPG